MGGRVLVTALALALGGCAASGAPVPSPTLPDHGSAPFTTSRGSPHYESELASPQGREAREPELRDDALPKGEAVPIDGSTRVRGRASIVVNAPLDKVRMVLVDFEKYPEFMPAFSGSKILSRMHGGWQLYQELTALHGTVRMWAHIKLPKPTVVDGVETYAGELVEGNVKAYEPRWQLRPVGDKATQMTVELFLEPKFFMPESWLNQKNVEAARTAALAMKLRVEHTP